MELKGINYYRNKLEQKRTRVLLRHKYYDQQNTTRDFNISSPPQLLPFQAHLGWCKTSVDMMADRLVFRGFENDYANLNEIFQMNNPDILTDAAIMSALISSCSFIYIAPDEKGYPRLEVIDGGNATGEKDAVTGLLTEGYAVLERSQFGEPLTEAYFVPGKTYYYTPAGNYTIEHNSPYPLLIPVCYRADDKRPFGRSRISRACMDLQDNACRTIKRLEISSEFFSYPQKWVTGLSQDVEVLETWKAAMSTMLIFEKDEDGEHPQIGQFQAQSMTPHLEQLRTYAAAFAGETGLTLDDLGFATGNPASSEAIKSGHEGLRLMARKAQRGFGAAFLNAGMVAACIRDNYGYQRKAFYRTTPAWYPVFEPDGAALSGLGDAVIKINQVIPDYITAEKLTALTGL